jgi:hypothetical protein
MKIKIREDVRAAIKGDPNIKYDFSVKLQALAGKWVGVETEHLFDDQYNTGPCEGFENGFRAFDSWVSDVEDDARLGVWKCGYCGKQARREDVVSKEEGLPLLLKYLKNPKHSYENKDGKDEEMGRKAEHFCPHCLRGGYMNPLSAKSGFYNVVALFFQDPEHPDHLQTIADYLEDQFNTPFQIEQTRDEVFPMVAARLGGYDYGKALSIFNDWVEENWAGEIRRANAGWQAFANALTGGSRNSLIKSKPGEPKLVKQRCVVCGTLYETGEIAAIPHKDLKKMTDEQRASRYVVSPDWGLCKEHAEMHEKGYIALVEADPEKSETLDAEGAYRTGAMAHIIREVAEEIFTGLPGGALVGPIMFVEPGVIDKLQKMQEQG